MTPPLTAAPPTAEHVTARRLDLPAGTPAVPLDHPYFEAAWLPTVGPTSWLLWRTLARSLAHDPQATWPTNVLAHRHGVSPQVVLRSLDRLATFRIAQPHPDATHPIATLCPPLWPSLLRRASPGTRTLHRQTFPKQ